MTHDLTTADLDQRCHNFLNRAEKIRIHHIIAGVLELGRAAVEELYDNDLSLVHDRSAAQNTPLHELMQKHTKRLEFLGITVEQVRAAMRAHEINLQLPSDVQGRLSPSHLRALAVVSSVPDRAEMASRVLEHAWSVNQTEAHVSDFRRKHGLGGKGGRPLLPAQVKAASSAARRLQELGDPAAADALDDKAKAAMKSDLASIKVAVDAWLAKL